MIVLDSVRPEWLSCYQPAVATSPTIDRIAREGILFETAISASSWTFPAVASLFTGMTPSKHGGHDESMYLNDRFPTMAEVFRKAGYDTAAIADVPYVGPMTGLDRGFNWMSNLGRNQVSIRSKILKGLGKLHRKMAGGYRKTNETPVVFGEAKRWLSRIRNRSAPFFLYIHSDETHAPFLPPAGYCRRHAGVAPSVMYALNQDKQAIMSGQAATTMADFALMQKLALAEVAYVDAWIGKLLSFMQRQGILENTVIVIAADHGENIGDHGLVRHALCLYDTLLKVPLIIHAPGLAAGRVTQMVRLIDLMPTLTRLAGLDPEQISECQGCDLVQARETGRYPEAAVSELYRPSQDARQMWERKSPEFFPEYLARFDRRLRSYRTATHKLIWSSDGRHELYDIRYDIAEHHNIIAEDPGLANQLQHALESYFSLPGSADSYEDGAGQEEESTAVIERLRELGYVD